MREIAEEPWNNWYHCMGHTYGTWLPGDPRGFRTRHHRENRDFDYRNPPPKGMYDKRWKNARDLMKRDPVHLTVPQRKRAVEIFVQSLQKRKIELIAVSIDRIHFHLLARFKDRNPRKWVGIAKKESSVYMQQENLAPARGLWAVRFECIPIADRGHQVFVVGYVLKHVKKGAAVWYFKQT